MIAHSGIYRKYLLRLQSIPPPGGGGCHQSLLGVANLGVRAGLTAERIFQDIGNHIPAGHRRVPDREVWEAINKAFGDRQIHNGNLRKLRRKQPALNGKIVLQKIIAQGRIHDAVELCDASPIKLSGEPADNAILLLSVLYKTDDLIWIGDKYDIGMVGVTIRTRDEWITHLRNGGKAAPHIIPNPVSGQEGLTKGGKPSLRCDNTIKVFRYAMGEFDNLSKEEQIRFWSAVELPISALIDTGGKSIHAWVDISKLTSVESPEHWQREIKGRLYGRILTPLGVDAACSNSARLSRLPGHYRSEKQAWQRLLWLSPEGRHLCR